MGRHSAPSRIAPRLKRTASNAATVLFVTSIATAAIYIGIALIANAKYNEIPPPTMTAGIYDAPTPSVQHGMPAQQISGADQATQGELRRCPATGCAASTCHAETGEPIPGR